MREEYSNVTIPDFISTDEEVKPNDKNLDEILDKFFDKIFSGELNDRNFEDEHKILDEEFSKFEFVSKELRMKYLIVKSYFETWEQTKSISSISSNIKNEILTMMTLFFAMFTFIQVNIVFIPKFLEKYNSYELTLSIVIINIVLLISLGFILEIVGAIVYGENRARIRDKFDKKYLLFFPSSILKVKRSFIYALIILGFIAIFAYINT